MSHKVQALHAAVGDFDSASIETLSKTSLNKQTGLGGGAPQASQYGVEGSQGNAGPVDADGSKQAMFDGVPFRSTGRVVANRDIQSQVIC